MLNNETLRVIQSGTEDEMYGRVTNTALFIAAGGYINQADGLLNILWQCKLPHSGNVQREDKAFMILWNASAIKPDNIPFVLRDIDILEKEVRLNQTLDRWATPNVTGEWTALHGIDLLRKIYSVARLEKKRENESLTLNQILAENKKADTTNVQPEDVLAGLMQQISAYGQDNWSVNNSDKLPSSENELLALSMLDKYFAENAGDDNLILAAELAAKNNLKEKSIQYIVQWVQFYKSRPYNTSLSNLCVCRHIAPLLLQHCIAQELSLTQNECDAFLKKIQNAIKDRMEKGRALAYSNLSWKALLQKISTLAIAGEYADDYTDETKNSGWLGFEKATNEAIAKTEERLGIALPEDYKNFLQTSNGFMDFPYMCPSLLPVEKIDYLRNVEDIHSFKQLQEFPSGDDNQAEFSDAIYRCILISRHEAEEWIWLIPPKNTNGDWQTWFFAYWKPGDERFPSFRFFIEDRLQQIDKT